MFSRQIRRARTRAWTPCWNSEGQATAVVAQAGAGTASRFSAGQVSVRHAGTAYVAVLARVRAIGIPFESKGTLPATSPREAGLASTFAFPVDAFKQGSIAVASGGDVRAAFDAVRIAIIAEVALLASPA